MKRLIIILLPILISAQTNFNSFISYLNSIPNPNDKNLLIDSLIIKHKDKIPIIEEDFAIFIYRGNAQSVYLAGDFSSWNPNLKFSNVSGTDFFYYSKKFEADARVDYKLVINGADWILDPLNKNLIYGGFGPNSELAMPNYVQPWEIKNYAYTKKGRIEQKIISSKIINKNYSLYIYLPNEYDLNVSKKYPSIYFQDGLEYLQLASIENILNNLIDSLKIEPAIGVFVKPNSRNIEYAGGERIAYQKFFAEELVQFIDSVYRTNKSADKRIVLGDSYGGNISTLISFNYSNIFGNLGIHSGAFQPNNYEAFNLFVNGEKKNIKIVSVWGTYESLYQNMREFRDKLSLKNYNFKWKELPEGHSWGLWRATIDDILQNFIPFVPAKVNDKKNKSESYKVYPNYPNPFNPTTNINYEISNDTKVSLKIFDISGKELFELHNNSQQKQGLYSVKLNLDNLKSGNYFCQLQFDDRCEIIPIIKIK